MKRHSCIVSYIWIAFLHLTHGAAWSNCGTLRESREVIDFAHKPTEMNLVRGVETHDCEVTPLAFCPWTPLAYCWKSWFAGQNKSSNVTQEPEPAVPHLPPASRHVFICLAPEALVRPCRPVDNVRIQCTGDENATLLEFTTTSVSEIEFLRPHLGAGFSISQVLLLLA